MFLCESKVNAILIFFKAFNTHSLALFMKMCFIVGSHLPRSHSAGLQSTDRRDWRSELHPKDTLAMLTAATHAR